MKKKKSSKQRCKKGATANFGSLLFRCSRASTIKLLPITNSPPALGTNLLTQEWAHMNNEPEKAQYRTWRLSSKRCNFWIPLGTITKTSPTQKYYDRIDEQQLHFNVDRCSRFKQLLISWLDNTTLNKYSALYYFHQNPAARFLSNFTNAVSISRDRQIYWKRDGTKN